MFQGGRFEENNSLGHLLLVMECINRWTNENKSRTRETPNLSTNADISIDRKEGWPTRGLKQIWGPMRGLKKVTWEEDKIDAYRIHIYGRTLRLLDRIGPVGRFGEMQIHVFSQHFGGSVMQIFEVDSPNKWRCLAFKQSLSIIFYNSNMYSLHVSLCHARIFKLNKFKGTYWFFKRCLFLRIKPDFIFRLRFTKH